MTQPLALLLYEKLLPGSQVANRLQDAGWRVQTLHDATALAATAGQCKPILALADLDSSRAVVSDHIGELRRQPATAHIPVIAFGADPSLHPAAVGAGATLAVTDTAILQHLTQFIDQALSEF